MSVKFQFIAIMMSCFWISNSFANTLENIAVEDILWAGGPKRLVQLDMNTGKPHCKNKQLSKIQAMADDTQAQILWTYGDGVLSSIDLQCQLLTSLDIPIDSMGGGSGA